jgi:hypothetical protein
MTTDSRKPGTLGKGHIIQIAIANDILPGPYTLITLGAAALKSATTLTISAPGYPLLTGQMLAFKQSNGEYRAARVAAPALAAATSVTVEPLIQAITNGAVSEFPIRLFHRTDASKDGGIETAKLSTDTTNSWSVAEITELSETLDTSGALVYWDGGRLTAEYARRKALTVFLRFLYPAPNADFTHGGGQYGMAIVSKMSEKISVTDFMTGDHQFTWQGEPIEIPALAI